MVNDDHPTGQARAAPQRQATAEAQAAAIGALDAPA
jgi:hypothetical protein